MCACIHALVIRQSNHIFLLRRIILSRVTWPAPQYFSTFPQTARFTWVGAIKYKMCVLIFSTTFVWNIPHSKTKWTRNDQ